MLRQSDREVDNRLDVPGREFVVVRVVEQVEFQKRNALRTQKLRGLRVAPKREHLDPLLRQLDREIFADVARCAGNNDHTLVASFCDARGVLLLVSPCANQFISLTFTIAFCRTACQANTVPYRRFALQHRQRVELLPGHAEAILNRFFKILNDHCSNVIVLYAECFLQDFCNRVGIRPTAVRGPGCGIKMAANVNTLFIGLNDELFVLFGIPYTNEIIVFSFAGTEYSSPSANHQCLDGKSQTECSVLYLHKYRTFPAGHIEIPASSKTFPKARIRPQALNSPAWVRIVVWRKSHLYYIIIQIEIVGDTLHAILQP